MARTAPSRQRPAFLKESALGPERRGAARRGTRGGKSYTAVGETLSDKNESNRSGPSVALSSSSRRVDGRE